jgi:hypothetical protein
VHVLLQVTVMIVEQQHRSCSGSVTGGHIINAITDLERQYKSLGTQGLRRMGSGSISGLNTMIRLSPRFPSPHSWAICKIPAGSGFGSRPGVSLVMIGIKT